MGLTPGRSNAAGVTFSIVAGLKLHPASDGKTAAQSRKPGPPAGFRLPAVIAAFRDFWRVVLGWFLGVALSVLFTVIALAQWVNESDNSAWFFAFLAALSLIPGSFMAYWQMRKELERVRGVATPKVQVNQQIREGRKLGYELGNGDLSKDEANRRLTLWLVTSDQIIRKAVPEYEDWWDEAKGEQFEAIGFTWHQVYLDKHVDALVRISKELRD